MFKDQHCFYLYSSSYKVGYVIERPELSLVVPRRDKRTAAPADPESLAKGAWARPNVAVLGTLLARKIYTQRKNPLWQFC